MNIIRKLNNRFIYNCPSMFCPVKKGDYCPLFETRNCPYDRATSYYCNSMKYYYMMKLNNNPMKK